MKQLKKRFQKLCLPFLICVLLFQGCTFRSIDGGNSTVGTTAHRPSPSETATYSYRTQPDETILVTEGNVQYLILANKQHALSETDIPNALVTLPDRVVASWHSNLQLDERAASALLYMLAEMEADGITDITVTSAYRSYSYQQTLFQLYLNQESSGISETAIQYFGMDYIKTNYVDLGITRLTSEDARKVVLSYSAYPGTSEHQTGLCVDFITSDMGGNLTEAFANTKAFAWLRENAYRFGFILRYPQGLEEITGYQYEPWHYRFVGREAATDIYFGNLTLEEYLLG